jgi:protein-tyrosine phosphatase
VGLSAELQLPAEAAAAGRSRCLPLLDLVVPGAAQLQRAVLLVEAQRRAGGGRDAVWVCCALGFSRSAAAVVGWLHRHGGAADAAAAEALVRGARPQVVLKPSWRTLLGAPATAPAAALSSTPGNEKERGTA